MSDAAFDLRWDPSMGDLAAAFQAMAWRLNETVRAALWLVVQNMARDTATKRMTNANPPYLNKRTGAGRQSVIVSPRVEDQGDRIRAWFGSNLIYIRAHELGFRGTVQVREHTRKPPRGGAVIAKAKGRQEATITVRAHQRQVNIIARHFMRDTMAEDQPRAMKIIQDALVHLAATGRVPTAADLRKSVPSYPD